jgi:hypothetical protein
MKKIYKGRFFLGLFVDFELFLVTIHAKSIHFCGQNACYALCPGLGYVLPPMFAQKGMCEFSFVYFQILGWVIRCLAP